MRYILLLIIAIITVVMIQLKPFLLSPKEQDDVNLCEIVTAEIGEITRTISARGTVRAKRLQNLRPKEPATIEKILVKPGEKVKKSQRLIQMIPTQEFIFRVKKALIHYHNLKQNEELCAKNLQRYRDLYKAGIKQLEEIEQIEARCGELQNEIYLALATLETLENTSGRDINKNQKKLEEPFYTYLISPFRATIIENNFIVGDRISPSESSSNRHLMIGDLSEMFVDCHLNEIDVNRIKEGQRVEICFDSLPALRFWGTVQHVASIDLSYTQPGYQKSGNSNFFTVTIALKKPTDTLKIGLSCKINIIAGETEEVVIVPLEAVVEENNEKYVFIHNNDTFIPRKVKTGAFNERYIAIEEGVEQGDCLCRWPVKLQEKIEIGRMEKRKSWLEGLIYTGS